jgi:hypothetical protein
MIYVEIFEFIFPILIQKSFLETKCQSYKTKNNLFRVVESQQFQLEAHFYCLDTGMIVNMSSVSKSSDFLFLFYSIGLFDTAVIFKS